MKYIDSINNSKLNKRLNEWIDKNPFRFLGIIVFFSCLLLTVLGKNDSPYPVIGMFIGLILFLAAFIWSWIVGIVLFEIYLLDGFIDDLNHSLFGNALIKIIIIYCAFIFLKFILPFREKILTKKILYGFLFIAFSSIGFIYNYLILDGSFMSGLEGGSITMCIALIITAIAFFDKYKQSNNK